MPTPPSLPAAAPLALTMGDPAGIGLEIALKAWLRRSSAGVPPFVLYADQEALAARARELGLDVPLESVPPAGMGEPHFPGRLPVRHVPLRVRPVRGQPDPANAPAVISAIETAVGDVLSGAAAALVTNPIAKSVLYSAGFAHPGHTEFLGHLAETLRPASRPVHPVMMLAAEELRVVPLTVHVPLADVPRLITRELIMTTARVTWDALRRDFGLGAPRIAFTGLNPHAGEAGTMGREEIDVIAPAVAALRSEGLDVSGPHPADTLFHAEARARYDAAIAMYHDQALIPIKTLAFDRGVNVTLGLPFVRTSPDHGTAFDIAAQGCANPASLIAALRMASAMGRHRDQAIGHPATSDGTR